MRRSARLTSLLAAVAALVVIVAFAAITAPPASADGHARIIRLSLVQGDVRFTRDTKGDPLTDTKAIWETAALNLPIREGYVLATDNGRAEIEFENGTMAFLNENTVIEFYDLSLEDGARTTRLVLRQGAASFYVAPADGDYFSVTGGDFTAEATSRATFRLDNFDDGSVVNVLGGHISVVRKNHTTDLVKGQSLSMTADNATAEHIGRAADSDDFDRWVSGREDSVVTATEAGMQYANNNATYTSGYGDLYTYGSWQNLGGNYGYGWQPFGVGAGWDPFGDGFWFQDSAFGWGFIGNQPWGWLPYHYGGWIYRPGIGWVWTPGKSGTGLAGGTGWRAATVNWVRTSNGTVGIVPANPADVRGKAPINLARGVFPVSNGAVSRTAVAANANEWKTEKAPPRDTLTSALTTAPRPELVSRTTLAGGSGNRVVTIGPDSSITYDRAEHRFVNSGSNTSREAANHGAIAAGAGNAATNGTAEHVMSAAERRDAALGVSQTAANAGAANASTTTARHNDTVTPRRTPTPAPSASARNSGGETWGGRASSSGSAASSHPSASTSPAASHPAAAAASSGGGGGRPH